MHSALLRPSPFSIGGIRAGTEAPPWAQKRREAAIADALDFAIQNKLDRFASLGVAQACNVRVANVEVMNMSLTEFDQEEYDRNRREEGYEEGAVAGKQEAARNMLADGLPQEKVAQYTGLSVDDIRALDAAGTNSVQA